MTKRGFGAFAVTAFVAAILAGGALLLTQPFSHPDSAATPPKPVSDVNTRTRACLFQAPAGSPAAQAAVQGLTAAARSSKHLIVQQFTAPPGVSAAAMLAELTALRCQTVVTVGSEAEAQVEAQAPATTGTRYLVIGAALPAAANVTVIPAASATAASVETALLRIVS